MNGDDNTCDNLLFDDDDTNVVVVNEPVNISSNHHPIPMPSQNDHLLAKILMVFKRVLLPAMYAKILKVSKKKVPDLGEIEAIVGKEVFRKVMISVKPSLTNSSGSMAAPSNLMTSSSGIMMAPPSGVMAPPSGLMAPPSGLMAPPSGLMAPPSGLMTAPSGLMTAPAGMLDAPKSINIRPMPTNMSASLAQKPIPSTAAARSKSPPPNVSNKEKFIFFIDLFFT